LGISFLFTHDINLPCAVIFFGVGKNLFRSQSEFSANLRYLVIKVMCLLN
jgi:hypothetical protein